MSEFIKNINTEEFEQLKNNSGLYLIDFWAEWCPPCRAMAPILEQLAPILPDVTFIKINVDDNQQLSGELEISSIPTFLLVKFTGDGQFKASSHILKKFIGAVPALDFKIALEKAIEESQASKSTE
ncbi:thioredoxin family protein [Candidatus Gracilibacteria bacterium]|nr:thioredoxin family protein [Candidatus Gracilibacteria bacterium]NJS41417.1 thioredoxin family protein [Candidatus Gracilibacteria bacterium]